MQFVPLPDKASCADLWLVLQAETRRQQTLLQEYKQHGKANVFQDRYAWLLRPKEGLQEAGCRSHTRVPRRRFGERVADMSHEEKMLQRLVKARTKQARKKSVFNLNDEEGDTTTVLTRFGRALGDSSYRDVQVDDDFGDDLEADIVNNLHFGGVCRRAWVWAWVWAWLRVGRGGWRVAR